MEGVTNQRDLWMDCTFWPHLLTLRRVSSGFCHKKKEGSCPCICLSTAISQPFPFQREKRIVGFSLYEFHLFFHFRIMFFGWEFGNSASAGLSLKAVTSPTYPGGSWSAGHSRSLLGFQGAWNQGFLLCLGKPAHGSRGGLLSWT